CVSTPTTTLTNMWGFPPARSPILARARWKQRCIRQSLTTITSWPTPRATTGSPAPSTNTIRMWPPTGERWSVIKNRIRNNRVREADFLPTSALHPPLQNQHCGHAVDCLGALLNGQLSFAQEPIRLRGGYPF